MRFSATFACARCRLRFPQRDACPSCAGTAVHSLTTSAGRTQYHLATQSDAGRSGGLLSGLARRAPQRPWIPMAIAVLMMMPAAIALASGVEAFEERWVLSDGKIKYQGLSSHGFEMIALAALGVLLGLFYATTILARRAADRMADAPSARTRVFSPDADADAGDAKATTLTGIARRASVEIEAPISGELCLVFGLCGPVGDADVDDADGGDFDLELPSGERVMISLEHARLVPGARGLGPTAGPAVPTKMTAALDEVLTSRGIEDGDGRAFLVEHLLRDGDEVRVTGDVLGGTVTALAYRSGGKSRVLAGDVDRPVAVRIDP